MKKIEVVAAVIKDKDVILATQRGYGEFEGGWEFPGGKVEPGETAEEAIVREIHEELDARIAVDRFLLTVDYDYPTFHLTMHCFLCHVAEGSIILHEHSAARWLSVSHLDEVEWLPADIEVVEAIKKQKILG